MDVDAYNAAVIEEHRANGGRIGGPLEGQQVLLLTHVGARSGTRRTNPLGWFDDDGTPVVFGSNMGGPRHPDWFHNVVAHPQVHVELGDEAFDATARVVDGEERAALWERLVAAKPFLAAHQEQASPRVIPLVRLERRR